MLPTPFLVLGDDPRRPTGLARIARDLCRQLYAARDRLGITLMQVAPTVGGLPWMAYPVYETSTDAEDWGAGEVAEAYRRIFGQREGVLWAIWDPSRLIDYLSIDLPIHRWGYFAVDAATEFGSIGGPAGEVIARFDRVLGYGRYGSRVLKSRRQDAISYLPHGIDLDVWQPAMTDDVRDRAVARLSPKIRPDTILIGTVATNQARKDWGLWAATLRLLKDRGWRVHGWIAIDKLVGTTVGSWAIQELVQTYHLEGLVSAIEPEIPDEDLAALYALSTVTLAIGLGEGYGYPIIESLACGTPVVHGDYAGGAELIPCTAWRIPSRASRLEGPYALVRPVFSAEDTANALERAIRWRQAEPEIGRQYCLGAVRHLGWDQLWPRFESWIGRGLRTVRGDD